MKAKDTHLLNNTIPQNPILARRAWFWYVVSHMLARHMSQKTKKIYLHFIFYANLLNLLIFCRKLSNKIGSNMLSCTFR